MTPGTNVLPVLLAVSPVAPWPASDGMSLRVSRLLENLSSRWSIVLVNPGNMSSDHSAQEFVHTQVHFPRTGEWLYLPSQYDTRPIIRTVRESVERHHPRVALLWSGMEYLRDAIPQMPAAVADRVDCMTLSAWRSLRSVRGVRAARRRLVDLFDAFQYERKVRNVCQATVVVGEEDARVLRTVISARNVHVVPNGVDLPHRSSEVKSARPTVIFTGVLSYQPNIDAVLHFADDVWPIVHRQIPTAVFQIVGRSPSRDICALANRTGIEVHADVESVHPFLARAWLAVAPMRSGSGLKNKILESWSVGTPAVMTPIATNGLHAAPSELLLAGSDGGLASLVQSLLQSSERRESLGALARETARTLFSWESQADAMHELLGQISV